MKTTLLILSVTLLLAACGKKETQPMPKVEAIPAVAQAEAVNKPSVIRIDGATSLAVENVLRKSIEKNGVLILPMRNKEHSTLTFASTSNSMMSMSFMHDQNDKIVASGITFLINNPPKNKNIKIAQADENNKNWIMDNYLELMSSEATPAFKKLLGRGAELNKTAPIMEATANFVVMGKLSDVTDGMVTFSVFPNSK